MTVEPATNEVSLRPCTADDAAALALVGQATFLETFAGILDGADVVAHCRRTHSPAPWSATLAEPGTTAWLATLAPGDSPIGYLHLAPASLPLDDLAATDLEIRRIYLLSRFHGGGLGRRLVDTAIAAARGRDAKRLLLGVYAGNASAIGFYTRIGFVPVGARTYRVGGRGYDDTIMALAL